MEGYGIKEMHHIVNTLTKLISTPLRNCDVGTAKEQDERFEDYCNTHNLLHFGCEGCPIKPQKHFRCFPIWAQMPYKKPNP